MKTPRIKLDPATAEACYHVMSKTVNGERLFDDIAKEIFRKQLWQISDYCGIQIITYAILSNHFHILVRVPRQEPLSDEELLRRFHVLYPSPTPYQAARLEVIRQQLAINGPDAVAWRQRQLRMMGDLSPFLQLLKQRFSIWFNKRHRRFGTLWASRFKSVLVEGEGSVLQTMAAYIDLNPVRAGLAEDPVDYRFCGYAEAVAGHARGREGLVQVVGGKTWAETQAAYRQVLFSTGSAPREQGATISPEAFSQVIQQGGKLRFAEVLRHRIRYFTDGAVLGSQAFVALQIAAFRERSRLGPRIAPRTLPAITDWDGLSTLRALRGMGFG